MIRTAPADREYLKRKAAEKTQRPIQKKTVVVQDLFVKDSQFSDFEGHPPATAKTVTPLLHSKKKNIVSLDTSIDGFTEAGLFDIASTGHKYFGGEMFNL